MALFPIHQRRHDDAAVNDLVRESGATVAVANRPLRCGRYQDDQGQKIGLTTARTHGAVGQDALAAPSWWPSSGNAVRRTTHIARRRDLGTGIRPQAVDLVGPQYFNFFAYGGGLRRGCFIRWRCSTESRTTCGTRALRANSPGQRHDHACDDAQRAGQALGGRLLTQESGAEPSPHQCGQFPSRRHVADGRAPHGKQHQQVA